MKVWVKFNAGFQLCPPDFNFAPPPPPPPPPPPRSREAGDAFGTQLNLITYLKDTFLLRILKALFFIKKGLKVRYFCKEPAKFRALWA